MKETSLSWRQVWAEKSPCGEMWIGWYVDEQSPEGVRHTPSAGDPDTAIFYARRAQETSHCSRASECHGR